MSIFGWSYPPGAANDPNAPYNQVYPPCEVCGQDECICPECPVCAGVGDPICYDGGINCSWCGIKPTSTSDNTWQCYQSACEGAAKKLIESHGLVRSFAQVALKAEAERIWKEENAKMNAYYEAEAEYDSISDRK